MVWPIIVGSAIGATLLTRSDRVSADPPADPEDEKMSDYPKEYSHWFRPGTFVVNPKTGERLEIVNNELGGSIEADTHAPDKWGRTRVGTTEERLKELGFVPEHEYDEGSDPDADPEEG